MEKLRNIKALNKDRKVRIVASFLVAGATLGVTAQTEGKEPYVYTPTPYEVFHPLDLNEAGFENKDLVIAIPQPSPSEKSLSLNEQKILDYQNETEQYVKIAEQSGEFSNMWIAGLKMYGPTYIAAAEKFGIDWKMLWITHVKESGASAIGSKAFDGSTYPYVGGMQRNQETWVDEFVEKAFSGLEYLEEIPTNYRGDAKEIAGAAAMMAPNMNKYMGLGKEKAIFNTFSLYVGSQERAQERLNIWIMAEDVFSPAKKKL